MPGQIFISYCHKDRDFAHLLAFELRYSGLEIWIDKKLAGGDKWREEIDKSIWDSSALVLVVTEKSNDSFYVMYEWIFALGAGIKVVPIKLEKTDPHPRLSGIQLHDFSNEMRPWDKLITDLKEICAKGQRKKSDTIAKAKQACSIEIPNNCPPIIEKAIMTLDSVTMDERRNAIYLIAQYNQPLSKEVLLSAMKTHPLNDVRSKIASVLGEIGNKEAVPGLIEALEDPDRSVRESAADALGRIGDKDAVPVLIEALKDTSYGVRSRAAEALGEIGDKATVPVLIEALKDTDDSVRCSAAISLGQIGGEVAVPVLVETLRDTSDWVCSCAAEALGKIGNKAAVPGLIEVLKDSNNGFLGRRRAAISLGQIGDELAVPVLIEALNHNDNDPGFQRDAKMALNRFGITGENGWKK